MTSTREPRLFAGAADVLDARYPLLRILSVLTSCTETTTVETSTRWRDRTLEYYIHGLPNIVVALHRTLCRLAPRRTGGHLVVSAGNPPSAPSGAATDSGPIGIGLKLF